MFTALTKIMLGEEGEFPNNQHLPVLHYHNAFVLDEENGVATIEKTFAQNGWVRSWVDGIDDFVHYHSNNHEVLGVAEGSCLVLLGGNHCIQVQLEKGDVLILPAGTCHKKLHCSDDFSCVGAYSIDEAYNMKYGKKEETAAAKKKIASLPLPNKDPVFGDEGPLLHCWK